ncbi:MAG TPA: AraC family transcriptional regulator [Steroidobacter sp.]|uniref:helix-turn-helix domain-containing protein n=1 Tax=Steroidobacter sp. TaxID=1978227 RepID=UPI002ED8B108
MIAQADYALAAQLSPYVRGGMEHWRGPWLIENSIVLDYLLVYIGSGTGRFSVADEAFDVRAGDLIWIPPNTFHEMRGHPPRMFVAYLHFDLVYDPKRSPRVPRGVHYSSGPHELMHPPWSRQPIADWRGILPVVNGPAVYALMKKTIMEHRGAHQPLRVSGLMLQLLGEIAIGLSGAVASAGAHWPVMHRLAQKIMAKPEIELSLESFARTARMSQSHFRRLFRETHGESPHAMQNRARMQKACELVLHSGRSVSEIALSLGFSTVHNFSRAFRREMGLSPREYQRRMLGPLPR